MRADSCLQLTRILVTVALAAAGSACGGGGSVNSSPAPAISVAITPAAATVQWGATTQLTATVSNDSSNGGVNWKISCSSTPCGALSSNSTASGTPTKYSPPIALPAANLSVTLTASSVTDPTKSATASITVPQLPGFGGVSEAHIDSVNGTTRLIISGQPTPPLEFAYQEDYPARFQFLAPQVQDAVANGTHLFEVTLNNWPWDNQGTAPLDFSPADQALDNILQVDPRALIMARISTFPGPGWKPPVAPTTADQIVYPDGPTTDVYHISIASDICFNGFLASVPHLLQHYEQSSYASHLLGYLFMGGNSGEWYPQDMWRGPDYSPVNTQAFQKWLLNKYGTDAALSAAWGRTVTISGAQVPQPQSGRFPMEPIVNGDPGPPIVAFYQIPQEQDWVDYSAYTSDLISQRILDIASLVRAQTGGKRLIGFINHELADLLASFNGGERGDRLLASSNIDYFRGGISYFNPHDRLAGGGGGIGSVIDSLALHSKLWFHENDLYTYLAATKTVDVLDRDLASALIHRAGTSWMDLNENGTLNDPAIWAPMSDHGIPLYNHLYANPQPYQADVALIIDRTSILYQRNDIDMKIVQRVWLRNALAKAGVSSGQYYLDDFLNGTSPRCKVYVFANTNYLTDAQISQIQLRLNTEGATAIWQYAPGFLGPNGADVTRASTLTGIQLAQLDGYGYTNGSGVMAGYTWGVTTQNAISPRLVVIDPNVAVLGTYQSDNQVSSALKHVGNFESIFIGEFALGAFANSISGATPSEDVLRALLQIAGVHIWSTTGDVVITDGNLLVVHAAAAGPDTISLPTGVTATPLGGGTPSTGTLNLNFSRIGETQWFQLSPPPQRGLFAAAPLDAG